VRLMRMRMRMFPMRMLGAGVFFVRVRQLIRSRVRRDYVDFCRSNSAPGHLAHFEARAHVQCNRQSPPGTQTERPHPPMHPAACRRLCRKNTPDNQFASLSDFKLPALFYAPRRARTSTGRIAFSDPDRNPVQSSVTYWKPACLSALVIASSISIESARGSSLPRPAPS